jgi:hypothetical protein
MRLVVFYSTFGSIGCTGTRCGGAILWWNSHGLGLPSPFRSHSSCGLVQIFQRIPSILSLLPLLSTSAFPSFPATSDHVRLLAGQLHDPIPRYKISALDPTYDSYQSVRAHNPYQSPILLLLLISFLQLTYRIYIYLYRMSKSATASSSKLPTQLSTKSAWAKGPPSAAAAASSPRNASTPQTSRPASPATPNAPSPAHSRRASTLGQGVPIKDGVSVPQRTASSMKQGEYPRRLSLFTPYTYANRSQLLKSLSVRSLNHQHLYHPLRPQCQPSSRRA